jgi:diacylglycerol kinase
LSWLNDRRVSFGHALRGVKYLLLEEQHARIHLLATLLVVGLGLYLDIARVDWQVLLLVVALVWLAEGLNTALEHLCDAVVPEQHPLIGKAKDVAAGSVLVTAGFAALIGAVIFVPYLA